MQARALWGVATTSLKMKILNLWWSRISELLMVKSTFCNNAKHLPIGHCVVYKDDIFNHR